MGNRCTPSSHNNHQQYAQEQQVMHIKDKRGNHIVKLVWDDQTTLIESDQKVWQKSAESQVYLSDKRPFLTVTSQGLHIQVTSHHQPADDWQIRFLDDTMQVLQTNQSIYQVVQPQPDKFWVYKSGREVGKTKMKNGLIDVDGYGIDLKIPAQTNAYAYTVLMMYEIPEAIRFTLMAELLKKGI